MHTVIHHAHNHEKCTKSGPKKGACTENYTGNRCTITYIQIYYHYRQTHSPWLTIDSPKCSPAESDFWQTYKDHYNMQWRDKDRVLLVEEKSDRKVKEYWQRKEDEGRGERKDRHKKERGEMIEGEKREKRWQRQRGGGRMRETGDAACQTEGQRRGKKRGIHEWKAKLCWPSAHRLMEEDFFKATSLPCSGCFTYCVSLFLFCVSNIMNISTFVPFCKTFIYSMCGCDGQHVGGQLHEDIQCGCAHALQKKKV